MRINSVRSERPLTHEGAPAHNLDAERQLRRTVMACMLWEDTFYEDGQSVADRIKSLVGQLPLATVAEIAIEAREKMKLRHVPLLLARECLRHFHTKGVGELIARIIQRPDECGELIAMVWADSPARREPNQMKRGIAQALQKFDAYQLAKWSRDADVELRDAVFLCHPKPKDRQTGINFAKLVNKSFIPEKIAQMYEIPANEVGLPTPETWEVRRSAGEDPKLVFSGMLAADKLGALALLRNLRKMMEVGVPIDLIRQGLERMRTDRVLPFRFITAARYAPALEPYLEQAMFRSLRDVQKLPGKTVILVDVSASMRSPLSARSEVLRADAACGLAILARELCEEVRVYGFSDGIGEVPPRRGFALRDAIRSLMHPSGTMLGFAVRKVNEQPYDRLIVITDEQSHDRVPDPTGKGYVINVASYQNGVGYGKWTHLDGWSEAVLDFIRNLEQM